MSVKSTLDKIAVDIADGLGIGFVELDDTLNVEAAISSTADMIVYQMIGMDEAPMDPLWNVDFAIGAKTTTDPANYDLASILSTIKTTVKKGETIMVKDYSAEAYPAPLTPPADVGYLYITDTRVDPQMFDGAAGIRMLAVKAAGVRYGS
jgi:hypothetical protein